ncbi:M48 family metalloprotease [Streptomyces sp. NPDC046900]|uniref:M48 family metalloprotease n=1 Tax=Streptomyces sp. NPDC046900 TaxID=3155473 RepID=UPI0033E14458
MRRFLAEQAPGTELRVSGRRDLLARVYPGGRRTARIGVFSPLIHLWVQDRQAAEAVLLHEVGHLRYGEQHVAGLGSPFTGLVRAWPYVFAVFGLLPVALLFASGNVAAPLMPAEIVLVVLSVVKVLLIVVGALWTAELAADRHAARTAGQRTHLRALNALDRRAEGGLARLYHPPVGVRRWFASRTERPSVQLLLVLLWPAAVLAGNLLDLFGAVTAYRLLGGSYRAEATRKAVSLAREQLIAGPVWWAMLATIALWPLIAGAWSRLWGWRGQPSDTFSRAAYVASALLPLLAPAVGLLPVGPTAGGSSQQAGDQGPGVAATPPAGATASPTPCPSRSRPPRPVRPEGIPSFSDARLSEDHGTARPTPDRTWSFRTLRVISVQPLSGSLTQAQDVADRLAHVRWTLTTDGTLTADDADLPALRTTAVHGDTRLLSGERSRTTDVSVITIWMDARLVRPPTGHTMRLDLIRTATGVTHAVVACRAFDSTVTTAARLALQLAEQ